MERGKRTLTIKLIAEALESTGGFISQAALNLDCSPRTIERHLAKSKALQDIAWGINCRYLDLAESKHLEEVKKGNYDAIRFHLRCKGKHRGYVERQELTGEGGGPLKQTIEVVFVEGNEGDAG
jgi:hypothetical protein